MKRRNEPESSELLTLDERAYDLLGDLIARKDGETALKTLKEKQESGDMKEIDDLLTSCNKQNASTIDRYFRKKKISKMVRYTIPKVTRMAAMALGVVFVAGSVAVATSQTFRVRIMELLYTVQEEYTEIELRENLAASFDVPADWEGDYFPFYLPDGIEAMASRNGFDSHGIQYVNVETGKYYINFSENGENMVMNIDTENAMVRPVMIRGNLGLISIKEGKSIATWSDGMNYFVLTVTETDKELLLKIANSVIKIK